MYTVTRHRRSYPFADEYDLEDEILSVEVKGPSGQYFVPSTEIKEAWPFPIDIEAILTAMDEDASGRNM